MNIKNTETIIQTFAKMQPATAGILILGIVLILLIYLISKYIFQKSQNDKIDDLQNSVEKINESNKIIENKLSQIKEKDGEIFMVLSQLKEILK